jgi:2-amino-4-hydroxy-6-hydroxymethyldihydropteridine diphosphokinase
VGEISPFFLNKGVGKGVYGIFLNGVVVLFTSLYPLSLLKKTQRLEQKLGRKKGKVNRPADLDILFWEENGKRRSFNHPFMKIPHPRWKKRWFVLKPLSFLKSCKRWIPAEKIQ